MTHDCRIFGASPRTWLALAALCTAVAIAQGVLEAAYSWQGSKWPIYDSSGPRELEAREAEIDAELAVLGDHPWAGWYHQGGGFSSFSLHLAPRAGYAFQYQ